MFIKINYNSSEPIIRRDQPDQVDAGEWDIAAGRKVALHPGDGTKT